jgi:hypothetical protein
MRLVIEARAPEVHRRRHRDQSFFFGVAVEARDRAQSPRDGRPRPTLCLQVPAEGFDVSTARTEQPDPMFTNTRRNTHR